VTSHGNVVPHTSCEFDRIIMGIARRRGIALIGFRTIRIATAIGIMVSNIVSNGVCLDIIITGCMTRLSTGPPKRPAVDIWSLWKFGVSNRLTLKDLLENTSPLHIGVVTRIWIAPKAWAPHHARQTIEKGRQLFYETIHLIAMEMGLALFSLT